MDRFQASLQIFGGTAGAADVSQESTVSDLALFDEFFESLGFRSPYSTSGGPASWLFGACQGRRSSHGEGCSGHQACKETIEHGEKECSIHL
jgi:hypothetical protein